MSKGSKRRPMKVPKETFDDNWDNIFGKAPGRRWVKRKPLEKEKDREFFVEEDFDVNGC